MGLKNISFLMSLVFLLASPAGHADPCGMVPPIYEGDTSPIKRRGIQKTYMFFQKDTAKKDLGLETLVIRPSFVGEVDTFGMLIPLPAIPAMRKVPDNIFDHIAAAVQPPELVIDFIELEEMAMEDADESLSVNDVRVLKKEGVGMYQIAVLEAGSNKALSRWMNDNGFRYPEGMDKAVQSYVEERWVFVAVKTRVGVKAKVDPRPGMRRANPQIQGGGFQGSVQAMAFRFWVKEPVVPMRLSTFNKGETRNIVYALSDEGVRIKGISETFVRRQIKGNDLYRNTHEKLPIRFEGGNAQQRASYDNARDPKTRSGNARALFASDLLATRDNALEHAFERREKAMLNISERLSLRGSGIDYQIENAIGSERERAIENAAKLFGNKTLTVIDGDFPRDFLRDYNLYFETYEMPRKLNNDATYDALLRYPLGQVPKKKSKSPLIRLWKSLWD